MSDERRPAPVELSQNLADALDVVAAPFQSGEFFRQIPQRPAGRPDAAGLPCAPARQMLPRQLGQHACAHQRRFAGARRAVNYHQTMVREAFDDVVDHPLAAEEDRPFFDFERAQPGVGSFRLGRGEKIRTRRRQTWSSLRCSRRFLRFVQPAVELAAPIVLGDVEALDTVARHVDRQRHARTVEHRAGQRRAAGGLDTLALIGRRFPEGRR